MRIDRGRISGAPSAQEGATFTGDVFVDPVLDASDRGDADAVMAYNVVFTPNARTHWHRHGGGQVLAITGGKGRVVSRRGEEAEVRAGDVVWTEPGEEHWHGADEDTFMSHLAVSLGPAEWLQPVTDREYRSPDQG